MHSVRLHHQLYSAEAIERTIAVFNDVGTFELRHDMPYYEVSLTGEEADQEGTLAGEFANYALAETIEEKRAGERKGEG